MEILSRLTSHHVPVVSAGAHVVAPTHALGAVLEAVRVEAGEDVEVGGVEDAGEARLLLLELQTKVHTKVRDYRESHY